MCHTPRSSEITTCNRRYYKPDEKEYGAPLFLDCSGLIRQIIFDLREDFGFTLAKWNQVYPPHNSTP